MLLLVWLWLVNRMLSHTIALYQVMLSADMRDVNKLGDGSQTIIAQKHTSRKRHSLLRVIPRSKQRSAQQGSCSLVLRIPVALPHMTKTPRRAKSEFREAVARHMLRPWGRTRAKSQPPLRTYTYAKRRSYS